MNKEAAGRLMLEASTGTHGDVAKQLADAWSEMAEKAQRLQAQLDTLAVALQLAMPLIEQQYFLETGSYGKNHSASRSEIARSRYEKARAALAAAAPVLKGSMQ